MTRLSDGVVLAWALALACTISKPRLLVIDREVFLNRLEKTLAERLEAYEAATPEQKRAQLELLVAASADVPPYDTTAPLRAVPPGGGDTFMRGRGTLPRILCFCPQPHRGGGRVINPIQP